MLSKAGLCGVLIFGLAVDMVVCRSLFPGYSGIYGFDLTYPNSPAAYEGNSLGPSLPYSPAEEPMKSQKRAYMRLGKRALMRLGKRSADAPVDVDEYSRQYLEKRARLRLG